MLQKKALIVFMLFVFWGYSAGCEKKPKSEEEHYPIGKLETVYTPNDAGKHDEVIKKYYPSGKLQKEERYKNNVKEGVYKEYYESGTIMVEGNYKDGKRDGIAKLYNKSGKLMVEANYKDDKRDGIYKSYNDNGKLIVEGNYKNGEIVSETCYDEQGNKKQCP